MTPENERPPTVPVIFGKPMVASPSGVRWTLTVDDLELFVDSTGHLDKFYGGVRGFWVASGSTPQEAASAIESRLRSLVLSLVPMLDEATRREVAELALGTPDESEGPLI